MFWIFTGAQIAILTVATFCCVTGFVQFQKLSHSFRKPYDLDNLLSRYIKNILTFPFNTYLMKAIIESFLETLAWQSLVLTSTPSSAWLLLVFTWKNPIRKTLLSLYRTLCCSFKFPVKVTILYFMPQEHLFPFPWNSSFWSQKSPH